MNVQLSSSLIGITAFAVTVAVTVAFAVTASTINAVIWRNYGDVGVDGGVVVVDGGGAAVVDGGVVVVVDGGGAAVVDGGVVVVVVGGGAVVVIVVVVGPEFASPAI